MEMGTNSGRRLFAAVGLAAVTMLVITFLLVNGALSEAGRQDVRDQTTVGAGSAARALGDVFLMGHNLAETVTGETNFDDVVQRTAGAGTVRAVDGATCNVLRSNPDVSAYYLFGRDGRYIGGQDAAACRQGGEVSASAVPGGWFARGSQLHRALDQTLRGGMPNWLLAFDRADGPYGSLYHIHPVAYGAYGGKVLGVLIERLDAASVFGAYMRSGSIGNLILQGTIVVGPDMAAYRARGELPVTRVDSTLDASITGGLRQTPVGFSLDGATPRFTLAGTDESASVANIAMSNLQIANYASAGALSGSSRGTIAAILLIVVLASAGILALILYLERRLRRSERENAERIRARSEAITQDIVSVSQALAGARDGDLTVQVPAAASEVGLLSLSLNGLLSDYSQIVGRIIRASEAVHDGAARVDQGVRRIMEGAAGQRTSVSRIASGVDAVAESAVQVQHATAVATGLAASAQRAVEHGQLSVGHISEAVDAIKDAAIGTAREFTHLQDDSTRLIALVSAVKNNAENLDLQAANASREARHLGAEAGSTFAANIGRLARQAQATLTDAEATVRGVVRSIDEMQRRIDRIAEGVRRGLDEVGAVRIAFAEIRETNTSLVQYIDGVADSAGAQALAAQRAAGSIAEIARVFEQFTGMVLSSDDEIASMRRVVADLQHSVANLRVAEPPLPALAR